MCVSLSTTTWRQCHNGLRFMGSMYIMYCIIYIALASYFYCCLRSALAPETLGRGLGDTPRGDKHLPYIHPYMHAESEIFNFTSNLTIGIL